MKAVVTADNHLNRYYQKMRPEQLEKRREILRENFSKAVDYAIKEDADLFLHCGDLFDMSTPRNQEVACVAHKMAELKSHGIEAFLVVGNHDMSLSSEASDSSPHSVFESFEGPNIFLSSDELESREIEVDGETVQISGLSYNPLNGGEDPLEGLEFSNNADWGILLTHYGIEGTMVADSDEAAIGIDTIKSMDLDLICSGHIHKKSEMELDGTKTIVPGGTETLDFNESDYSTGFYMVKTEDEISTEYIELDSQPMESIEVNIDNLENPQESIMESLEEASNDNKMLQLKVKGNITRTEYLNLDLHEVWELGRQKNFFFDLKDDIQLEIESGIETDGERLSQKEELQSVADKVAEDNEDDAEIIQKASNRIITDYREK